MSSDPLIPFETIPAATILREMFDRADIGMTLVDISTRRFLRVNAKLCEITGYSEQELLNTTSAAITHPDDRAMDVESFERFTRGETDRRVIEKRYMRRDGTSVWVHITTTIVQLGDVRCTFGITEDITARRANLAALEAAERRKNYFLATLAHELRNPLAAIRNSSALLNRLPYHDETFDRIRDIIGRQSHNLEKLVDDLLDSARITADKITLDRTYVGIAAVIGDAVDTVRHQAEARHHTLSVSLPSEDVALYGDKLRLVQIVVNLLTNAIRYTPEGGRIEVEVNDDGKDVVIAVTDTGVGIGPEELPHIFGLFEQARPPAGTQGGLGIGLAITKRLTELHGGRIHVRSHPGLGSTFKVRLPYTDRRVQPTTRTPAIASAQARILVVEDNTDVAETMALVLNIAGHDVRVAANGASALGTVREWMPDVFLIDLGLPDMDGCDLVQRLRKEDPTKSAYMVAVSGYGQQSDIKRSLAAGFDKHLAKPVDFDVLVALLTADRRRRAERRSSHAS